MIRAVVEYRGLAAYVGAKQRGMVRPFNNAVKYALVAVGHYWRNKYLPKHFTVQAYGLYQYKKRVGRKESAWYRGHKQYMRSIGKPIQQGRPEPLVDTGDSKEQILRDRRPPRVVKKRGAAAFDVIVPISAPKYFYQYTRHTPDKFDELTRTTMGEARSMAFFIQRKTLKHMERNPRFVKRRIA